MKTKVCVKGIRPNSNMQGSGYVEVEAFKWITIDGRRAVLHRDIHRRGFGVSMYGHRIAGPHRTRKQAVEVARKVYAHRLRCDGRKALNKWLMGKQLVQAQCLKFGEVMPLLTPP